MKARPILFSAPMIRALLDGTKTQTRRIVKGEALKWLDDGFDPAFIADPGNAALCPYGAPGDLLWVRETLRRPFSEETWLYVADGEPLASFKGRRERHAWSHEKVGNTCVSIHMPRWASRITLRLVEIRVERLHALSEEDARAEGASPCANGWWFDNSPELAGSDARGAYYCLWEKINGPGSRDANPWVWVLDFKVHRANVDRVLADLGSAA